MKLLDQVEVDQIVSDMWDKIYQLPEDEPTRDEMVTEAVKKQEQLYKDLHNQQRVLQDFLNVCSKHNPENPLRAVVTITKAAEMMPEAIASL